MMGYLCMKAVYEHTPYLHDREKYSVLYLAFICIAHKKVNKPAKITDKETTVDPIRCLAVMKLARSIFTHKN